jgi:hypothetical protein
MSTLEPDPSAVDELIALFAGVEHEDGGWITTPCYTVPLASAIAEKVEPASEIGLRRALYGERACDSIDAKALYVLQLGYQRYRQQRDARRQAAGRRGL